MTEDNVFDNTPDDVNSCLTGTGVFNGELSAADPFGLRPNLSPPCSADSRSPFYDTYTVVLPQAATLSVLMQGQTSGNGTLFDPIIMVYQSSPGYDPADPCANIIDWNDDSGGALDAALSLAVPAGTYTVVATTFDDNTFLNCCGTYKLTISV